MNYKNGDKISIDLATFFSAYDDVVGEYYQDENGNVEIYIPKSEFHTEFYIKLPKDTKIKKTIDKQTK